MLGKILVSKDSEFCDKDGNAIQLRGVNLDPSVKFPAHPFLPTRVPTDTKTILEDAEDVSFINHPLPLDQVELHVNKLRSLGYNCIRFPFTWESLEHKGPGQYDLEYIDYVIEVLRKIHSIGGIYVYLDPHQDVWSRFCGGSGAPLWTLYCAGFQPSGFRATEAAVLHSDYTEQKKDYPKMLWPTNYYKLACQTMFTLFFAGNDFAPKCKINGENIQDYLQGRFIDAVMFFYLRVREKAPELFEENCIIGLETINEPNCGFVGEKDLSTISKERNLKRGLTPTAFQSFMLGEGHPTVVEQYDISIFGPTKTGLSKIEPNGTSCWLTTEERTEVDARYKWERGSEWEADQCLWRLHGVWREGPSGPELIQKDYFARLPDSNQTEVNEHYFINHHFVEFYKKFHSKFRSIDRDALIFMQGMVFREPPKALSKEFIDERTVYACHYYDGMSLMFKTWNRRFNVDTFGIVRNKYLNPAFSIVLGESNIRKSIRRQLRDMKLEVKTTLNVPCFFTEIGMPMDMDNRKAYKDGDFSSQISATDALLYALEGENLSYSLWCYCTKNGHNWGDEWNNEDFSIYSSEDAPKTNETENVSKEEDQSDLEVSDFIPLAKKLEIEPAPCVERNLLDFSGIRVLDAVLRPFPIRIHGTFTNAEFDLVSKTYSLEIYAKADADLTPDAHSFLFLPRHQFPLEQVRVRSSSGRFAYYREYQVLKWYHSSGKQWLKISLGENESRDPSPDCIIA